MQLALTSHYSNTWYLKEVPQSRPLKQKRLKVSKSQKQFFLKVYCPKNE